MSNRIHPVTDETLQRVAQALEAIAGSRDLEWDSENGYYTNDSLAAWLNARRDGLAYGISIPTTATMACTKLGANAGMAAPTPGYVGVPATDPYVGVGPFRYYLVNGYVEADGTPRVTAIQGDGRFARDGSNGSVWNMHPVIFERFTTGSSANTHYISDTQLSGMAPHSQCYMPDGGLRPYMLTPVYLLGTYDSSPASVSGIAPRVRDVSHNSGISICSTASTGYSLKSTYDDWYVKTMFRMKYGTKHTQSVFAGCSSYYLHYAVTVAETGATRVIVATSNAANLVVGSTVTLGSSNNNASVLGLTKILSIEAYDSSNSAVNLDVTTTFDTTTSLILSTEAWFCGCLDDVEGDGAISQSGITNGKEPFKLQGIECMLGVTEILGNVILSNDGTTGWVPYVNHDSRNESTSVTSNYTSCGTALPTTSADGWKYPLYDVYLEGLSYGTDNGGSSTTGLADGSYTNKLATTGTREWLGVGHLNYGAIVGLWCVAGSNGLGDASWNIGSRLSATGRAA